MWRGEFCASSCGEHGVTPSNLSYRVIVLLGQQTCCHALQRRHALLLSLVTLCATFAYAADPGVKNFAAPTSVKPGDDWSLRGMAEVETSIKEGSNDAKTSTVERFVLVNMRVRDCTKDAIILEGAINQYPADAQLLSESLLAQTAPLLSGRIMQKFPLKGKNTGQAEKGSTFLAPLVEDYFLPALLPPSLKVGQDYSYSIPLKNPTQPDQPWDALLTAKIVKIAGDTVDVDYEYVAPQQSPSGKPQIRFKANTKGSLSFERKTGRILQKKTEQSLEMVSGDKKVIRSEKVSVFLKAV